MKVYALTTGTIFGLLTLAHVWRIVEEGSHLATDPLFALVTDLLFVLRTPHLLFIFEIVVVVMITHP